MEILTATDFSELAADALHVAVDYARRFGARLHVMHVAWPDVSTTVRDRLERLERELAPDLTVVTVARVGVPSSEIVAYAVSLDIDLIVLGTHGRTGLTRALTGSVAERVVRLAPCPVLTVPRRRMRSDVDLVREAATERRCVSCGRASSDLICEPCRARIRGEALEHRRREEQAGHTF
jgi:nucleotide-binding universal stress UspA family protein